MASIWDNVYNLLSGSSVAKTAGKVLGGAGGAIHQVGTYLGDPVKEFDVSEQLQRLGGMLNPPPAYATDQPQATSQPQTTTPSQFQTTTSSQPQQTSQPSSGGGGGQWLTGEELRARGLNPDQYASTGGKYYYTDGGVGNQPGYEQAQPQQQIDWDAIYAPALNAYRELANIIQGGLAGTQARIGSEAEQNIAGLETELGLREGQLGQQREQATSEYEQFRGGEERRTESAIAEARRQANELMQGIQSRFGTSTGTGQFTSELLGREAMRGIGQYRTGLQETIGKAKVALENTIGQIDQSLNSLREQVALQISNVRQQATSLKEEARQNVMEQVAQINARVGETETAKAQQRTSALQQYRQYVQEVNARNTQWEQQLYVQAQQMQQGLNQLKSQAVEEFKITLPSGQQVSPLEFQRITGGLGEYAPALQQAALGQLTGTVDEDQLRGAVLPWQQQAGQYGLINPALTNLRSGVNQPIATGAQTAEQDNLLNQIMGY